MTGDERAELVREGRRHLDAGDLQRAGEPADRAVADEAATAVVAGLEGDVEAALSTHVPVRRRTMERLGEARTAQVVGPGQLAELFPERHLGGERLRVDFSAAAIEQARARGSAAGARD